MLQQTESLIQISQPGMAGVESAKKALWALLRNFGAGGTAKLTVTTVRGKLEVILEESFTKHSNVLLIPEVSAVVLTHPLQRDHGQSWLHVLRQLACSSSRL